MVVYVSNYTSQDFACLRSQAPLAAKVAALQSVCGSRLMLVNQCIGVTPRPSRGLLAAQAQSGRAQAVAERAGICPDERLRLRHRWKAGIRRRPHVGRTYAELALECPAE